MKKHQQTQPQGWGSSVVAEISVSCRSKIPIIPELSLDFTQAPLTDFEYDFILEREVIADHDQYLNAKSRLERAPSTGIPLEKPNDSSSVPDSTLLSSSLSRTSNAVAVSVALTNHSPAVCHSSSHTVAPPIAARQLVLGQILQPSKTEPSCLSKSVLNGQTHGETNTTATTSARLTPVARMDGNTPERRPSFLHDFESGPDDPFGSAELKTINDMEELSNVLNSTSVSRNNIPSTCSSGGLAVDSQPLTVPSVTSTQTTYLGQTSSFPQPSTYSNSETTRVYPVRSDPPLFPMPYPVVVPDHGVVLNTAGHTPSRTVNQIQISGPHFARPLPGDPKYFVHPHHMVHPTPKLLSSSVPNLETSVNMDRPHSVTAVPDMHTIYRPVAMKPVGSISDHAQPTAVYPQFGGFIQHTDQTSLNKLGRICRTPNARTPPIAGVGPPLCPNQGLQRFPTHQNSSLGP